MNSILKTAVAVVGAMLVSNILLAGTSNPPPPQPITCAGGNAVTGFSYGTLPTCGTPIAGGTINTGTAGQLTDYSAATAVSPITTGTGVVTALGVNTGSAGAFVVNGGDAGTPSALVATNATGTAAGLTAGHVTTNANLTGDVTSIGNATTLASTAVAAGSYTNTNLTVDAKGRITAASTGSGGGGTIASTTSALAGDGAGNAVAVTGTGTNCVLVNGSSGACGGGGATGYGVDGGTTASSVTGTGTIPNAARLVKVATGWATGTLTLPAISAVSADTCIRVEDGGNFIDGTHTLTLKGGVSDGLNGGAANGTVGPFTTPGSFLVACVSATNNWNVGPGSIAASTAPTHQFANSVTVNGLGYAQPALGDVSGVNATVATALAGAPQGNGAKVQLSTGAGTSGKCVEFDANGNTVVAVSNAACGSGGAGVTCPTGFTNSNAPTGECVQTPAQSNVTSIPFTIPAALQNATIRCSVTPATNSVHIGIQFSQSATYDTTTAHYQWGTQAISISGAAGAFQDSSTTESFSTMIAFDNLNQINTEAAETVIQLHNLNTVQVHSVSFSGTKNDGVNRYATTGGGTYIGTGANTAVIDGVRIIASSGNITGNNCTMIAHSQ